MGNLCLLKVIGDSSVKKRFGNKLALILHNEERTGENRD
jgi:hypothetical protein